MADDGCVAGGGLGGRRESGKDADWIDDADDAAVAAVLAVNTSSFHGCYSRMHECHAFEDVPMLQCCRCCRRMGCRIDCASSYLSSCDGAAVGDDGDDGDGGVGRVVMLLYRNRLVTGGAAAGDDVVERCHRQQLDALH